MKPPPPLWYNPDKMNDAEIFRTALSEESRRLGVEFSAEAMDAMCLHYRLLCKWNPRIRLVGTIEPRRAAIELFADSLAALRFVEDLDIRAGGGENALQMIDIGSGAGFPGIPIKILRPRCELTIVDSSAKRTSFLKALVREPGLPDASVIRGRAEGLAHDPSLRERFDLAFCRAVAAVPVACELAVPFLKVGGSFIAQASSRADSAGTEAAKTIRKAAEALGATIGLSTSYKLSGGAGERSLIQIKKLEPTPEQFPRERPTMMKKPLA